MKFYNNPEILGSPSPFIYKLRFGQLFDLIFHKVSFNLENYQISDSVRYLKAINLRG